MCSGWKSRHDWNDEEWWRGVYGLAQGRCRALDEDQFVQRVKSRVWVIQKLGVSKLFQKDKPWIRPWKLNWTKAKGISKAQSKKKKKKRRVGRHRAQKEFCWTFCWQPHPLWLHHSATLNGLSSGTHFETHPEAVMDSLLSTKKGPHIYEVTTFIRHWSRKWIYVIPSSFVLTDFFSPSWHS